MKPTLDTIKCKVIGKKRSSSQRRPRSNASSNLVNKRCDTLAHRLKKHAVTCQLEHRIQSITSAKECSATSSAQLKTSSQRTTRLPAMHRKANGGQNDSMFSANKIPE